GFANVYFQDTQHLCDVAFQVLFYLTPIIYEPRDLGPGRLQWLVTHANPFTPVVRLFREPILYARVPTLDDYGAAGLTGLAAGRRAVRSGARLQGKLIFPL